MEGFVNYDRCSIWEIIFLTNNNFETNPEYNSRKYEYSVSIYQNVK